MKDTIRRALWAALALMLLPGPTMAQQPDIEALTSGLGELPAAPRAAWITRIEISGIDAPRAGRALDERALVEANDGISWELPVIWADLEGEIVTRARAGEAYLPFIAFYVPAGYGLRGVELRELANVTLPEWLRRGDLVFLEAPSAGVVFITGAPLSAPRSRRSASDARPDASPLPPGDVPPARDGDAPTGDESLDQCRRHADEALIQKYGADALCWLIRLVRECVQPQAVNTLLEAFPAYQKAAADDGLGRRLGLRLYGSDDGNYGSVAYGPGDSGGMSYLLSLNVDSFPPRDGDAGERVMGAEDRANLDNTVLHEMMHAFMVDYARNGMYGLRPDGSPDHRNRFPLWFSEGVASLVEMNYALRYDTYARYGEDGDPEDGDAPEYTPENLTEAYRRWRKLRIPDSIYTAGYLASAYLSALAADSLDIPPADTADAMDDRVREGLNDLLERLRRGSSLDEIIREISPPGEDGAPVYSGIDDFEARFMTDADPCSAEFCARMLSLVQSGDGEGRHGSGSILRDLDDPRLTAFDDEAHSASLYRLTDSADFEPSTADAEAALQTGGACVGYAPGIEEISLRGDAAEEAAEPDAAAEEAVEPEDVAEETAEPDAAAEEAVEPEDAAAEEAVEPEGNGGCEGVAEPEDNSEGASAPTPTEGGEEATVEPNAAEPEAEPVETAAAEPEAEPVEADTAEPEAKPVEPNAAEPEAEPVETDADEPESEPAETVMDASAGETGEPVETDAAEPMEGMSEPAEPEALLADDGAGEPSGARGENPDGAAAGA